MHFAARVYISNDFSTTSGFGTKGRAYGNFKQKSIRDMNAMNATKMASELE